MSGASRRHSADRRSRGWDWGARSAAALLLLSCVPEVGLPPSRVVAPRVIAVQAEPPELAPGERVRLRLWVATPSGPATAATLADASWDFCRAPKPPSEDNFVSPRCLQDPTARLPIAATGPEVEAEVPAEACAWHGPQAPPSAPGEPSPRPRDADASSGYYQPLRVVTALVAQPTIAAVRIQCGLATAPPETAAAYRADYRPNQSPLLPRLAIDLADDATGAGLGEAPSPGPIVVPVARELHLSLQLPLGSAEDYLRFDLATQALQSDREVLRVSWFATAGALAESVSAVTDRGSAGLLAGTLFQPGSQAGPAWLWAVLRDSRGAVAVLPAALRSE